MGSHLKDSHCRPHSRTQSHHSNVERGTSDRSFSTRHDIVESAESFRGILARLEVPCGLLTSVLACYKSCYSIIWLIDNSSSMKVHDSHVVGCTMGVVDHKDETLHGRLNSFMHGAFHHDREGRRKIEKRNTVTRWHEIRDCLSFQSYMAAKCWIRTKLWLVNVDNSGDHKFSLCCGSPDDVPDEVSRLKSALKHAALLQDRCPLSAQVHKISKIVSEIAPALNAHDQRVTVVICTQGVPTDEQGTSTRAVQHEFWNELKALSKLPVKLIIRLCTDNEDVMNVYNKLDHQKESIDVLDDYWGEAMEVHLHNPWLTYGIGLHRLREAGLLPEIFGILDEQPLTLDQLHEFCKTFFVGDSGCIDLPHPRKSSWNIFSRALKIMIDKEKSQWNPVEKRVMPWIDLDKLDLMHGGHDGHRHHSTRSHHQPETEKSTKSHRPNNRTSNSQNNVSWRHSAEPEVFNSEHHHRHHSKESTKHNRPETPPSARKNNEPRRHSVEPQGFHAEESSGFHYEHYHQHHSKESTNHEHPSSHPSMSRNNVPRRHTTDGHHHWHHSNASTEHDPRKIPAPNSQNNDPPQHRRNPRPRRNSLTKSKIQSTPTSCPHTDLQNFILTVPRKFPPTNTMVEPHAYFDKWKAFDSAAFVGVIGDELTELLLRASKKVKFFLHPDKLPKDLTEKQTQLFKTLWNDLQEKEASIHE